jgi:hypothetical protein
VLNASGNGVDVALKRAPFAGLGAAPEVAVAASSAVVEDLPTVVVSGGLAVVFFFHGGQVNRWQYRRLRISDNTFLDAGPVNLSSVTTTEPDFHAARDRDGNIWAGYRVGADVRTVRLTPATGALSPEETHDANAPDISEVLPFLLPSTSGDVWLFWRTALLHVRRFRANAWEAIEAVPNTQNVGTQPCAVEDADGGIWLFWSTTTVSVPGDIFLSRRDPVSGGWSQPRQLTFSPGTDELPFALTGPEGATWLFWAGTRAGETDLFFRRLAAAL